MPVYNAEKYLNPSIKSILNQTFKDFELIIIDDGSTDNSNKIIKSFQQSDTRIKLISRDNKGLTPSLNEGLNHVQGKYVARMDADDIALPKRFATQLAFLETHIDHVALGSRVLLIDPEGLPICPFIEEFDHETIENKHLRGCLGSFIVHPSVMMCHEALQKVGGYDETMEPAEDLDLFLRLAEIGYLANYPDILLKYRMHSKSIGHSRRLEQKRAVRLAVNKAYHRKKLDYSLYQTSNNDDSPNSIDGIHRKWAWWALKAGNIETAKKHSILALSKNPASLDNWKVFACSIRGY